MSQKPLYDLAHTGTRFCTPNETPMAPLPEIDELLKTVASLESLGKNHMKAMQGIKGPCQCSCHTDASIVHIGPLCCEKTLAE